MLNKLKLNNLIISNKSKIQQGRIQTINRQVHKLRKLKGLLEKRPEDGKIKEKYRKATETMEQLKQLKRGDILRKILVLDRSPSAIVTNGLSSPEEIAIAMLALNSILMPLMQNIREQLQLTDNVIKDELKAVIMEESKRRVKINRTEDKRRKRKELKEQKAMERNRNEWLQENKDTTATVDEPQKDDQVTGSGVWKEEEDEPVNVPTENQTEVEIKSPKKMKIAKEQEKKLSKTKPPKEKKLPKTKLPKEKKTKKVSVKPPVTAIDSVEAVVEEQEKIVESIDDIEPEVTHVVDSFFLTATGENYLSTAVVTRNNDEQDGVDGKSKGNELKTRAMQRAELKQSKRKLYENRNEIPIKMERPPRHSERNQNRKPLPMTDRTPAEKLHPSWEAKQKFKPIITNFQGKKTTFNDDSTPQTPAEDKKKTLSLTNTRTKGKIDAIVTADEKLHPSWAAKQKQKPVIAAFQGKKITFDAGDD